MAGRDRPQREANAVRILCLSTAHEGCGVAAYAARLRQALEALGHTCEIFPIDLHSQLGLSLEEAIASYDGFVAACAGFDAIVIQHEHGLFQADFVMNQSIRLFLSVVRRVRKLRKPILIFFHTPDLLAPSRGPSDPPGFRVPFLRQWKALVRLINWDRHFCAITHSRRGRALLVDIGLRASKTIAIVPPLPAPKPLAPRSAADGADGADDGRVVLAIFGFVYRYKGYRTAVQALCRLPKRYHLLVIGGERPLADPGDDTTYADLRWLAAGAHGREGRLPFGLERREIDEGDLADRITVTGYRPDAEVTRALARADLVLAPYLPEGPAGSGAMTWGLASGRPVIASSIPAFAEIEEDYDCIVTVPPDCPDDLARAILELSGDPERMRTLVGRAERFVRENGWDALAERVVRELTRRRRTRG